QRNSLNLLLAVCAHDAENKIDTRSLARAREQIFHLLDGSDVVSTDAINDETTLDARAVGRSVGLDRADEHSFARRITERVGQIGREILQLHSEETFGNRSVCF